ncbi:MAG: hypothetical protein ABIQ64_00345 [Candidatus Saccharimonadales bacterium]
MIQTRQNESGLVSILTVVMFTIFISIMVVGFIKIMTDEQRQTTDNDLSASALAAAQSGVEDAKRIILYCSESANQGAPCDNMLNSANAPNECSVFTNGPSQGLFNSAKINYDATKTSVLVGDEEFQQSYTCLTIDSKPQIVQKPVVAGKSTIIPLSMDALSELDITWSDDSGTYGTRNVLVNNFTPTTSWVDSTGTNPRPPVLRAQIIPYTPGSVNLDASESASDTFFFVSTSSNGTSTSVARAADSRGAPGSVRTGGAPIVYTLCATPAGQGYSCTMKVTGFTASPSEHYYLRLSLVYGSRADITISGQNSGTPVTFDGTQYAIDVTGRANDVFRRIRSRVSPSVYATFPEYAVESSGPICKDIQVGTPASTQYTCSSP